MVTEVSIHYTEYLLCVGNFELVHILKLKYILGFEDDLEFYRTCVKYFLN